MMAEMKMKKSKERESRNRIFFLEIFMNFIICFFVGLSFRIIDYIVKCLFFK